MIGCGKSTITIKAAETSTFGAAVKKISIVVIPEKGKIKTVVSPNKGRVIIKWKKDKNISGYVVQITDKKSFVGTKLQRTFDAKVLQTTVYPFKSKKKYYIRMRTYKKIGTKKYYSVWSDTKSVRVK